MDHQLIRGIFSPTQVESADANSDTGGRPRATGCNNGKRGAIMARQPGKRTASRAVHLAGRTEGLGAGRWYLLPPQANGEDPSLPSLWMLRGGDGAINGTVPCDYRTNQSISHSAVDSPPLHCLLPTWSRVSGGQDSAAEAVPPQQQSGH